MEATKADLMREIRTVRAEYVTANAADRPEILERHRRLMSMYRELELM